MLWWTIRQLKSSDVETCRRAADKLGESGNAKAVEPLILALKEEKHPLSYYAENALVKCGAVAVEPLITALKDSSREVRREAAKALGKIGDARAVEPLIDALNDSHDWIRRNAVEALGKIGDKRAVEPLIAALKDSNWDVRKETIEVLVKIGDARAVEPLIVALTDSPWQVQSYVAEALGKIGDARAVKPLIASLKDKNWYVLRDSAAEALGKIGTPEAKQAVLEYEKGEAKKDAKKEKLERKSMATIKLNNTPENRYLKQVFDHLKESHRNTSFGYHDIPDPSPEVLENARQAMASSDTIFLSSSSTMVKSHIMVLMKSLGLRESVGLGSFSLTNKARDTIIELY